MVEGGACGGGTVIKAIEKALAKHRDERTVKSLSLKISQSDKKWISFYKCMSYEGIFKNEYFWIKISCLHTWNIFLVFFNLCIFSFHFKGWNNINMTVKKSEYLMSFLSFHETSQFIPALFRILSLLLLHWFTFKNFQLVKKNKTKQKPQLVIIFLFSIRKYLNYLKY